eukprot:15481881-Alexandrium_andersonii.AAC.1
MQFRGGALSLCARMCQVLESGRPRMVTPVRRLVAMLFWAVWTLASMCRQSLTISGAFLPSCWLRTPEASVYLRKSMLVEAVQLG